MPPVTKLNDKLELVSTTNYPEYATFPFEHFNPLQSRVFDFFERECNSVISARTAAGKTVTAEMVAAHHIRVRKGKVAYLAPMKSLANEKYDDWTDASHHFSNLNISICTGDYRLTDDRRKEIEAADIVILTSEMMNARTRNYNAEKNEWLKDLTLVITDEVQLLTVPGRGDHLEVGLMNLTKINPNVKIMGLSGTMPNSQEIAEWVSYSLTGSETYLLESNYQACPLGIHYETYWDRGNYDDQEREKINSALQIIDDHPDDKFLLFVHTKKTGELLKKALKKQGLDSQFHSADLEKAGRIKLEKQFKTKDSKLKYLIATSTLAWGVNLSARRVIVLGVHRGLNEVAGYDIRQMVGRSGRPGYDPRGDAYILLPESKFSKYVEQYTNTEPITSKLLDNVGGHYKNLAFHLVSEIHHGAIKNKDDVHDWYKRSLAYFQTRELDQKIVDNTIELLIKYGAIKEENGEYIISVVGKVASMFYFSPFDVADLRRNFAYLFKTGKEKDDLYVSMALGNIDSIRMGIVSKAEREEMGPYSFRVYREFGRDTFMETAIKGGFCYHSLMSGNNLGALTAVGRTMQWDFPRAIQVLISLDSMGYKWNKQGYFKDLLDRVGYGVDSHLIPLVKLPDIGKVRAEKLWAAGIKTPYDITSNPEKVQLVLNMKAEKILAIVAAAKTQLFG